MLIRPLPNNSALKDEKKRVLGKASLGVNSAPETPGFLRYVSIPARSKITRPVLGLVGESLLVLRPVRKRHTFSD